MDDEEQRNLEHWERTKSFHQQKEHDEKIAKGEGSFGNGPAMIRDALGIHTQAVVPILN